MKPYEFEPRLRKTLESSSLAYAIYQYLDGKIKTLLVSDGLTLALGLNRDEAVRLLNEHMYAGVHPDDKEGMEEKAIEFAKNGAPYDVTYRQKIGDDPNYHTIHAFSHRFPVEEGLFLEIVWYQDLALEGDGLGKDDFLQATLLPVKSLYDPLTGLPNMLFFLENAEKKKNEYLKNGKKVVVLAFDLTGMKGFNMKYGIEKGNVLLCSFAKILKKHYRSPNVSRFGDDHFCALTNDSRLEETFDEIFQEMSRVNDGVSLPVRIGVYQGGDIPLSKACDRAKAACDDNRHAYVSKVTYFSDELQRELDNKDYVINHLEKALKEGWIQPFYQPIVRAVNGQVSDEEALARWIDPDRGMLAPADFIPILEDAQLLYKVDLHILDCVLRDFKKKEEEGIDLVPVSINISRYDFGCCDMVEEISRRVRDSGYPPRFISVEITESVFGLNIDYVKEQIKRFHERGFEVWMDDFGSGYSSLNVLQDFEVDTIKLDMRFMRSFENNKKNRPILTQIVRMAEKLNIDTICEGVEKESQVAFLKSIGCDKLQGYYYSQPNPLKTILERSIIIGKEKPEQSDYYQAIGNASLTDPEINGDEGTAVEKFLMTTSVGILEVKNDQYTLLRCTDSYKDFCLQNGLIQEDRTTKTGWPFLRNVDMNFARTVKKSIASGNWESSQQKIKGDKANLLVYVRPLAHDSLTGADAVMVVLSTFNWKTAEAQEKENEPLLRKPDLDLYKDFPVPVALVKVLMNPEKTGAKDIEFSFANEKFCEMMGLPQNALLNHRYLQNFNEGDKIWVEHAYDAVAHGKTNQGQRLGKLSGHWLNFIVSPCSIPGYAVFCFPDVDNALLKGKEGEKSWTAEDTLIRITKILNLTAKYETKMQQILYELGTIIHPDRLQILETDRKIISNTFEWCKPGVPSVKKMMQRLPFDAYGAYWEEYLFTNDCLDIKDIENVKESFPLFYEIAKKQGVKRLIAVPFYHEGVLIGYLVADNYELEEKIDTKSLLFKVSDFLEAEVAAHQINPTGTDPVKTRFSTEKRIGRRQRILESLGLEPKTSTQIEYVDHLNMRMAKWTSLVMAVFEFSLACIFGTYVLQNQGLDSLYTSFSYVLLHNISYSVFFFASLGMFFYSTFFLKGKFNKAKRLSHKTQLVVDIYIIICNLFGVLTATLEFQSGNQSVALMTTLLYSFLIYRINPIKASVFLLSFYALYGISICYIPMIDPSYQGINMTIDPIFGANVTIFFIIMIVVTFVFYKSIMNTAGSSIMDRLTKTKNRYCLDLDLKRLMDTELVVMMMDIDNFKHYNDTFGHEVGDIILQDVAKALKFVFDEKCVYRYGGDEFLIIRKGDKASFEKCLATLQSSLDDFETMDIHITYSAGYKGNVCHNEADLDNVIREADALLYQAKKHGKGKTVSE